MRCPFPGMDPYLERLEIWADFHDSLITYIGEALQPSLRPRYVALTQRRLYVVEHEEEIRQPVLHIIEPAAGNRIVTAIEVLSPDNKTPGEGRDSYQRKLDELWDGGANLVEIDLLRGGQRSLRVSEERAAELTSLYLIAVSRRRPSRREFYQVSLEERLPRIGIPLAGDDPDVLLELQPVFSRCWEAGPYPELLHYDDPPPGAMDEVQARWCRRRLAEAGFQTNGS